VPLFLLDADRPENGAVARWISSRLYTGTRDLRLAQYLLLGVGGMRALKALGVDPAVVHLNEGHAAFASLELARTELAAGASLDDALAAGRARTVFTTHTPVPAGNETYPAGEFLEAFADLPRRLEIDGETFLDLCRIVPGDHDERPGMTALALRVSGRRNAVSRLHGEVARELWSPLFQRDAADVPIGHVTNGAHLPTFLGEPMYRLLSRHLGDGWLARAADPATWEPVRAIPNDELWAARCESRERLIGFVRERSQQDGLRRGEQIESVRAVARRLDPSVLTLGFARRLATYKRLHLMTLDPERAHRLLGGERPVQLLIAGKAHPADEPGKDTLQRLIGFKKDDESFAERVVFIDDYDLEIAARLVSGCDVWVNLPRRPMEASGTSGMKATFNGVLQLSVLDGWWAEAYDGTNGWAIAGDENEDFDAADAHDASEFYDLLENEVIPLFYERDDEGVPQRWCDRIKEALVTCAPVFNATRMVNEYAARMYPADSSAA
jgi:starch phosphorylase